MALALQIIEQGGFDQSIRVNIDADSGKRLLQFKKAVDKSNEAFVKDVLRKYGYPSKTDIGELASDALFLLVQHVSDDIAFQKNALFKMQRLVAKNEINKENVAYLTDRIMVTTTGRQLYGTQFLYELSADKKKVVTRLYPVLDSMHLQLRRKEMGL